LKRISKTKDIQSLGYPNTSYEFSKAGLISITRIQQRMFNVDPRPDIVINSVCPGFVSTDMTNNTGYITADQGSFNFLF
jgi:NAD(P)-dependent dehydrogenase (short-subunit alcohol dehydrogenase family)